jgi:hypothetical protein
MSGVQRYKDFRTVENHEHEIMTASCSGTPLVKKLDVKPGFRFLS